MNDIPFFYDYQNAVISQCSPSTVHCRNTTLSRFFQRYLLQKAMSVFKWDMPDNWSADYVLYTLYCRGFFAVVNTDKYGVIPQACGLGGYDIYYRPTTAIIANPLIKKTLQPIIGKSCTLIKLQPDYGGIMDLVSFYADLMALCAENAGVNLVNSKLAYVFAAQNKNAAESFKKLFDTIASGDPAAVVDKSLFNDDGSVNWRMFNQDLRSNYIAGDVLSQWRKLEIAFCADIGLPNANEEKKAQISVDEVNANNAETASKASLWLETLQDGCSRCTEMFTGSAGFTGVSVDWRFKGGADDDRNIVYTGPV